MTPEPTSAVSFALIQAEKRSRFDPLKDLTAEKLVAYLDEFRAGQVQNLARVMDSIEERDDVLVSVVPKAKASVARHGWEVLTINTENEAEKKLAEEQKAALEYFYNHLRATSALDQDEMGGMSLLLRQMMDAKGKRYAVHNLVWSPRPEGRYTATFHFVPLWFFENSTGKMRFISQPFGFYGEDMAPGEWLVTKGQGVMIACSVAWMYKRLPLRDWLIYCSRHGMPGIEGVTDAAEGSDEWNKLVTAVEAAAKEFAWVRSRSSEIKTIEFSTQGQLPYAPLVERMDRAMAAIWRGGDLSTMSKDGSAVGANPQASETVLMEEDDAAWLSETLQLKVDRLVLDYIFGEDAPALAYVKVLTAQKQNTELDLKIDEFALRNGHPIARQQFAERYNRPEPGKDDELLTAPATQPAPAPQPAPGNVRPPYYAPDQDDPDAATNEANAALAAALTADLQPILDRLDRILSITDEALRTQKLREFLSDLESLKRDVLADPAAARVLEGILAGSFFKGVAANADEAGGHWVTVGGNPVLIPDEKWTGTPKEMRVRARDLIKGFKPTPHPSLGEVHYSSDGREKSLSMQRTAHEFQAVAALPKLIRGGAVTRSVPDRKNRKDVKAFHTVENHLQIGDAKYHVQMTVKETTDGRKIQQKFYMHRLTPNEKGRRSFGRTHLQDKSRSSPTRSFIARNH